MIFEETNLDGAWLIRLDPVWDERGFHARAWCRDELTSRELETDLVQCNVSFNGKRGTLRGLHYQREPFGETKLIRCTAGAIYDVILDLRTGSPTFGRWKSFELSAANRHMIYVPKGFAHGFLTLEDDSEVFYMQSSVYSPDHARGVRWDDPLFAIEWPEEINAMSSRDRNLPDHDIGSVNQ